MEEDHQGRRVGDVRPAHGARWRRFGGGVSFKRRHVSDANKSNATLSFSHGRIKGVLVLFQRVFPDNLGRNYFSGLTTPTPV